MTKCQCGDCAHFDDDYDNDHNDDYHYNDDDYGDDKDDDDNDYGNDDDDDDDEKAEVPWPTSALRRKSRRHSDHSYLILPVCINDQFFLRTSVYMRRILTSS